MMRLGSLYNQASLSIVDTPPTFVSRMMVQTGLSADEAAALYWDQLAWWQYRLEVIPYVNELSVAEREEFEGGIR